jgi:hypothetical protein
MPDSDPPPTQPTPDVPANQKYVDDAIAMAIADVKEHFDRGVATVVDELKENRRLMGIVVERLDSERDARRRGLRIVKDDISRLDEKVEGKLRKAGEALLGDVAPGANGGVQG